SALPALFMPTSSASGPLTMRTGPAGCVVETRPSSANAGSQAASTAASTIGKTAGGQPAITALIATFSTVAGPSYGGTSATRSWVARLVASSISTTRVGVGGTKGRPSE